MARLLFTLVFVLVVGACAPSKPAIDRDRVAIERVLQARIEARARFHPSNLMPPTSNDSAYVALLGKIDTEACPLPFREAWLDYVHAWERRIDHPLGKLGASAEYLIGAVSTVHGAPGSQPVGDAVRKLDSFDTTEPWMRIETVYLQYGVTARRN